jgi:hypothetical protein
MPIDDEIDDEESKRQQALSEICQISRHGIVDGVEFDFRHELLDPREWQMDTIGIDPPPHLKRESHPLIWFPWYGEFSEDSLRHEANLNYDSEKNDIAYMIELSKEYMPEKPFSEIDFTIKPVEEYIRQRTPECIIRVGDRVIIVRVNRTRISDGFDHDHDSELRYAVLNVIRSTGIADLIRTPIKFRGATSITTQDSQHHFFDKICRRICHHFQVQTLESVNIVDVFKRGRSFASNAALHAHLIRRQMDVYKRFADIGDQSNPHVRKATRTLEMRRLRGTLPIEPFT